MPLIARNFSVPGKAWQSAWKTTMLARSGIVRMPTIRGVVTHEGCPGPDVLLLERTCGISVEAPVRTSGRWGQLKDRIIEALLTWHRQSSRDCVGAVDNTQENFWPSWYRQHVEVLWITFNQFNNTDLMMQDRRISFRIREYLLALSEGFNDNCVLIYGSFCLRSTLEDSRNDQLLAMAGPGLIFWALRKYELLRPVDNSLVGGLLWSYLQRASVVESFI